MKGKKGFDISMKFVIMWIILPIVAGVIILVFLIAPTASALGEKGYADNLCHLNAGFRSWSSVKAAIPLVMCYEKSVTVDADNYKLCDPDGKNDWKDSKDTKRCAEQQIFSLMSRCYYKYGESHFDVFQAFNREQACFAINIRDLSTPINEETLTNFMMEQKFDSGKNYCSYIANNRIGWATPACGGKDQIDWDGDYMKTQQVWRIIYYDDCSTVANCPIGTSPDKILITKV